MLELHGVSVAIAGVKVLREVSLAVPAGGRVALIGRNGAGKTTTLRALMGLVPVSGGQVVIEHGTDPHAPAITGRATASLCAGGAAAVRQASPSRTNMLLPAQVLRCPGGDPQAAGACLWAAAELRDLSSARPPGCRAAGKMVARPGADDGHQGGWLATAFPGPGAGLAPLRGKRRTLRRPAGRRHPDHGKQPNCCAPWSSRPMSSSAGRSRRADIARRARGRRAKLQTGPVSPIRPFPACRSESAGPSRASGRP